MITSASSHRFRRADRDRPLVSVITPFHNTAKYLEECIESVLAQTYDNWEYILLDNCSTDESRAIAERYAAREPRIRFISSPELLDQVSNYNRALSLISPESRYCKMVQADDWIFPRCIEEMVGLAETSTEIGVVGSYTIHEDVVGHLTFPYVPVMSGKEAVSRYLTYDGGFMGSPTCVLLRSDLVRARKPFFHARYLSYEDLEAWFDLLTRSAFGFVFQVLTFNRRSNNGFWAEIENFGPQLLHSFILIQLYGNKVMSEQEYTERFATLERRYYSMMASAKFTRKGASFWKFHLDALEKAGIEFNSGALRRALLASAAETLRHPVRAAQHLLRRR